MEALEKLYGGEIPFEEAKSSKNFNELHHYYREYLINRVDDEGVFQNEKTIYTRDKKPHCCGSQLKKLNGGLFCEVCASFYK